MEIDLPLEITFLDVGQGDGTIVMFPQGEVLLFDLGSKKNADILGVDVIDRVENVLARSADYRKYDHYVLDYLFISHGDGDHYNMIPKLKEKMPNTFVINEITIGGRKKDFSAKFRQDFLNPYDAKYKLNTFVNSFYNSEGYPHKRFSDNNNVDINLYLLSANYPSQSNSNKNAKSLVVMIEYGTVRTILTGDAEKKTEKKIIKNYEVNPDFCKTNFLKLGHHGSVAGTSVEWLNATTPKGVFVSSDMRWAHPYCDTIARVVENCDMYGVYKHWFMCGDGAGKDKEWHSFDVEQAICTAMAYAFNGEPGAAEPIDSYKPGKPDVGVAGVAYILEITPAQNGTEARFVLSDTFGNRISGPTEP